MEADDSFWISTDGQFGVCTRREVLLQLLTWCRNAKREETGGILVGYYQDDGVMAQIAHVLGPPPDSRAGRTWFRRGVQGVDDMLHQLWRIHRYYYLGEWHYHPAAAAPFPSLQDHVQMRAIARNTLYACPEPILLIMSDNPSNRWQVRLLIYPNGQPLTLVPSTCAVSSTLE